MKRRNGGGRRPDRRRYRILVWGLGRVGSVSAACLAERGHRVFALDIDARRVDAFRAGGFPDEPGLSKRIREGFRAGRLRALVPGRDPVPRADFSWICVGTTAKNGRQDLRAIGRAVSEIGALISRLQMPHTVLVRSTVPPGTTRRTLWPLLRRSARPAARKCRIVVCPEFLREGTAVQVFLTASYHVVGSWSLEASSSAAALLAGLGGQVHFLAAEEAELLKLAGNAFHAAKAAFANEIGRLASALAVDGGAVLQILRRDRKLNASGAYLKPGMPFGGSCLPRDIRILCGLAKRNGAALPLLEALVPSNRARLEDLRREILARKFRSVGIVGLGFKPGVADLRESPSVDLARRLRLDGIEVRFFDRRVDPRDPALRK
ncbi:MAG TPA: nucleotide sugar dehydrogenase, partial [Thermoanaerobaculia bacterium]